MKKRIVVLTGAGMSAESGISTFRDSGGLWEKYRIEEVATAEALATNLPLVLEFYNTRRKELFRTEPNEGHKGLVALEKDFDVRIITQNVDNLHERAGSTYVLHLHGEMTKVCPMNDTTTTYELTADKPEIHVGDTDPNGVQLRPFIVLFGEAVPNIELAIDLVREGDIFIVIGTSLNVYPAAGLLNYVPKESPIFLIDPNEVTTHRSDVRYIKKGASEGVRELLLDLGEEGGRFFGLKKK